MDRSSTVPIPDPTALTTDQLLREIKSLKDLIETRLNGMDSAIELRQSAWDRLPEAIDEKIAALKNVHSEKFQVHEEKFRSIAVQFSERDTRSDQTSRDSKVAVDAALQAAKEAVSEQNKAAALSIAKSESGTDKRIDQQALLITTAAKAADDKIADVKERLSKIEGKGEGGKYVIALVISLVGMVIAVMIFVLKK